MKCSHLVALCNVVGVTCDEYDLYGLIVPADPLGHGHTVHGTHFNIQQENIPVLVLCIAEQEAFGGGKNLCLHNDLPVVSPIGQNALYIFCIGSDVIYDCHTIGHGFTAFLSFLLL